MNGTSRSKAGLFLFEFTIMLLVFALASTVSLRMFAKSRELQISVEQTDAAVAYVQTTVERLKSCGGQDAALTEILGGGKTVYLDADFAVTTLESAVYAARADYTKVDSLGGRYIEGTLSVSPFTSAGQASAALFELPFGVFYPAEGGAA